MAMVEIDEEELATLRNNASQVSELKTSVDALKQELKDSYLANISGQSTHQDDEDLFDVYCREKYDKK